MTLPKTLRTHLLVMAIGAVGLAGQGAVAGALSEGSSVTETDICDKFRLLQNQEVDTAVIADFQENPIGRGEVRRKQGAGIESRLNRVLRGPLVAMKDYFSDLDPAKKVALIQKTEDLEAYRGIEDGFRQRAVKVAERHRLYSSACLEKTGCSSDGTKQDNIEKTRHYKRLDVQFHVAGKPAVVACNYEGDSEKSYLTADELGLLKQAAPELALYFADDMGWKNACLRVPLSADSKSIVFDPEAFLKAVGEKIVAERKRQWLEKREQVFGSIQEKYDDLRQEAGCFRRKGQIFDFKTNAFVKPLEPEIVEQDPEIRNAVDAARAADLERDAAAAARALDGN